MKAITRARLWRKGREKGLENEGGRQPKKEGKGGNSQGRDLSNPALG